VTTQRSAASTANHYQDHQHDALVREHLRLELIKARRCQSTSDIRRLSRMAGRNEEWLYRLENHSDSKFWMFNNLNEWGRAVGLKVWIVPDLYPVLPEDKIGPLARAGVASSQFSGVGFLEYCRDWRVHHGIEQRAIMRELEITHSTAWAIEESTNPRVLTMQRYIRALGGVAEFQTEFFQVPEPALPSCPF
jgi:hypothetical protein